MRKEVIKNLFIEAKPLSFLSFENPKEIVLIRRLRKKEKLHYDLDSDMQRCIYVRYIGDLVFILTKFFYNDRLKEGFEELSDLVKLTLRFMIEGKEDKLKILNTYAYDNFLIISNSKLKFKKIRKPKGILIDFELEN